MQPAWTVTGQPGSVQANKAPSPSLLAHFMQSNKSTGSDLGLGSGGGAGECGRFPPLLSLLETVALWWWWWSSFWIMGLRLGLRLPTVFLLIAYSLHCFERERGVTPKLLNPESHQQKEGREGV